MLTDIRNVPTEELMAQKWTYSGKFPKIAILMITHNRLAYTKKALSHLLRYTDVTSPPFDLYIVDNASTDQTREYLKSLNDKRIVDITFNQTNRALSSVTNEFWYRCLDKGYDLVGKVDNDTLVPRSWLYNMVRTHEASNCFGALGCFSFDYYEDFDFDFSKNAIRQFGKRAALLQPYIGGCAYTIKTWVVQHVGYLPENIFLEKDGKSIERIIYGWDWWESAASKSGFVHGYLYPFLCAEHMDDPMSYNCLLDKDPGVTELARRNAEQRELQYSKANINAWIRENARKLFSVFPCNSKFGKRLYK